MVEKERKRRRSGNGFVHGPGFATKGRVFSELGECVTMTRTYVDISFSSSGMDAHAVARRLQRLAKVTLVAGDHDLYFDWKDTAEFEVHISAIHRALAGTGATYRVRTEVDPAATGKPVGWLPPLEDGPVPNPAYPEPRTTPGEERIR